MKASELRIGNWFNSVKFGVPVICELTDFAELCHRSDGAYNDPPIDEMFEPIPLTEEWLLKFGFKKRRNVGTHIDEETAFYWLHDYSGIGITIDYFLSTHDRNYDSISVDGSKGLEYVHELQNLYFALTGEELEIVK